MANRNPDSRSAKDEPEPAPAGPELGELSRAMLAKLSSTIEGDLIPRLMLAFETPPDLAKERASPTPDLNGNLDEFVHLLLNHDASVANQYVATLRRSGVPLPVLYLQLLGPAARRLGTMWEEDECSFTDVTIGVCRMHEVLLEFSRCFDANGRDDAPGRNVLILPSPGEQHTFGLFMVIEFFRRSGWTCFTGTPTTGSEFQRLAQASDFDAIGISASAERHIDGAAEQIARIRRQPRTSDVVIIAGGRAFLDNPDLATEIGADAMAIDAEDAVHKLNRLCRAKPRKRAR